MPFLVSAVLLCYIIQHKQLSLNKTVDGCYHGTHPGLSYNVIQAVVLNVIKKKKKLVSWTL